MTTAAVAIRPPEPHDGVRIWQLACTALGGTVQGSVPEGVELDSRETYLLLSRHFRDTSLVAECDGELLGFAVGWRPPATPDTLFVWRLFVAEEARRRGIGRRLLRRLLASEGAAREVAYLEMLVAPSQRALRKLLAALARELGAPVEIDLELSRQDFVPPDGQAPPHEEANRFCIGPIEHGELSGLIGR